MELVRKFIVPFGQAADHSIDYLLGMMYDARVCTLYYVQDITPEELDWQYADGWNTVGALLSHIIAAQEYFREAFINEREPSAEEMQRLEPGLTMGEYLPELRAGRSIQSYIEELAAGREKLVAAVRALPAEKFHRTREGYDKETGCNLAWVLYHLVEDEVHHRGQISIIRKLYRQRLEQ